MTPAETAFCEDLLPVMRKHGLLFPKGTMDYIKATVNKPRTLISMIGFQNLCLSRYCVESILEHTEAGTYELRLTNNGSNDGTKEYFDQMASQFPQVKVVHNAENEGFQKPNNEAFEHAKKNGFRYMVCANNDAVFPAGWLEKLIEAIEADPKCSIVGPLTGCSRVNADMCGCDDTKLEFIEGSAMLFSVEKITTLRGTGPLFARWLDFIYCDDLELSLAAQYAGQVIRKAPFRIQHRGSQTAGAHPEAKERCAAANRRNQGEMKRRYAHWNKVRRFDHPIILRRAYASGDILLATPVIRALKEKYALCPIYFETGRPEILEGNPYLALAAKVFTAPHAVDDAMVIDLNGSYERDPSRHVIDSYALAAGLEPDQVGRKLELHCSPLAVPEMANGKWCAIAVGPTNWPGKNWPMDRFNSVVQVMRQRGYRIALLGDGGPIQLVPKDYDARGQSGVRGLAGILKRAELFIGLCSFPAHCAAALDIPSVVLYGVTDPRCFAAYTGKYRAVCSDPNHPDTGRRNREANVTFVQTDDSVVRTISVDDVLRGVDEICKP